MILKYGMFRKLYDDLSDARSERDRALAAAKALRAALELLRTAPIHGESRLALGLVNDANRRADDALANTAWLEDR